jgi:hypothetical protein
MGNHFAVLADDGELLTIHGEINGRIKDKVEYSLNANWYDYSLTQYDHPFGRPEWDAAAGLKYNLRNKILAGAEIVALGNRRLATIQKNVLVPLGSDEPVHVNINLSAEYRYTKILSFWLKVNNIAFNKYYEWAYYPTQRFVCMIGFSYSL